MFVNILSSLLIQLWITTLHKCLQNLPFPKVLATPGCPCNTPWLSSFHFFFYHCNIYDYLIQTFLFNSMSSPFSCLVPYFWLLFSISTWSDIHSPTASSFVKPFFHTAWTTFSEHFIFFSSKTVIDFCCPATPNSAVCLDISRPVKSSPSLLNLFFLNLLQ